MKWNNNAHFLVEHNSTYLNCDTITKIRPINIEKHRITIRVDTHNIPYYPSLSVSFVNKVCHEVRNSLSQFLSLFIRINSIYDHHSLTENMRSSKVTHIIGRQPTNKILPTNNMSVYPAVDLFSVRFLKLWIIHIFALFI